LAIQPVIEPPTTGIRILSVNFFCLYDHLLVVVPFYNLPILFIITFPKLLEITDLVKNKIIRKVRIWYNYQVKI